MLHVEVPVIGASVAQTKPTLASKLAWPGDSKLSHSNLFAGACHRLGGWSLLHVEVPVIGASVAQTKPTLASKLAWPGDSKLSHSPPASCRTPRRQAAALRFFCGVL